MKIKQDTKFSPITITIETRDEAVALWDIVNAFDNDGTKISAGTALAQKLSNAFSEQLKV